MKYVKTILAFSTLLIGTQAMAGIIKCSEKRQLGKTYLIAFTEEQAPKKALVFEKHIAPADGFTPYHSIAGTVKVNHGHLPGTYVNVKYPSPSINWSEVGNCYVNRISGLYIRIEPNKAEAQEIGETIVDPAQPDCRTPNFERPEPKELDCDTI